MTIRPVVVQRSVLVSAPAHDVWAAVSAPAGVNAELMPLVRMVFPRRVSRLDLVDVRPGELVCRCVMLAGGVVPFDVHSLRLAAVEVTPDGGGRFDEISSSLQQRSWRHERSVVALGEGACRVTDRVTVIPRATTPRWLVAQIVPRVFEHRHRRLHRRWGAAVAGLHF